MSDTTVDTKRSAASRPAIRGAAKAAGINSGIAVLRRMASPQDFSRFLAGLPPELAALVLQPPVATSWVPLALSVPFYERAHRQLFAGNDERMFELGRQQLREDLSTLYRVFIRIASPSFIAERIPQMWGTYVRDAGTMRLVCQEDRMAELAVEDYPAASLPFWPYMRGTIHGTLELTGVQQVAVKIVEGGGATTSCRYRATWR